MAEQIPGDAANSPFIDELIAKARDAATDPKIFGFASRMILNALQEWGPFLIALVMRGGTEFSVYLAQQIIDAEEQSKESIGKLARVAIRDVFGVDVNPNNMKVDGGRQIGEAVMKAIAGNGGAVEPSAGPAQEFTGFMAGVALEGWLQGWLFEMLSSCGGIINGVETFAELDDTLISALGLNRLSRRALSPLVDVRVATPMRWHVNKIYRPELLSPAAAIRQMNRGRWSSERAFEEISRHGYSDERIEALRNEQAKYHSVADLDLLVRARQIDTVAAVQHLRDQGYEEPIAEAELKLERLKRIASFERALAGAAIDAYADYRIDDLALTEATRGVTIDDQEGAQFRELAKARRVFRRRRVSMSDAEQAVKARIWAFVDYRDYLRREGYDEDAILTKELLLRHEIDERADIEALRAAAKAERDAERLARDVERNERKRQVEAERALRRRGSLAALERAAVRGLIPFSRVQEVLAVEYDGDTVGIYLELIEADRQSYLEQQQRAEDARQRATRQNIGVSAIEQAVLAGVLTLQEFAGHPALAPLTEPDRAILVQTLAARLADREAAKAARRKADEEAGKRRIDLTRAEQLVVRGVRPMTQYVELLRSLGFDAGSIAAMVELLELKIADATEARTMREEKERELQHRGLSLEQVRRNVLLGVLPIGAFERMLIDEHFTGDAQIVLVAELRADLVEADAARRRRAEADEARRKPALPLATVRRAARLGVVSPATYEARLLQEGYSADDIALELELLLFEIANVQAQRARRDTLGQQTADRGLSLAQVEAAVTSGEATIEAYRARAIALGYGAADVELLVTLLEDERASQAEAELRRSEIAGELGTRQLSLGQLETAVKEGLKSLDAYAGDLQRLGYGSDDVDLLVALLVTKLDRVAA